MKVLELNVFVKLPDDFDGDFSSALRWFADYHETAKKEAIVRNESQTKEIINRSKMWRDFLQSCKKGKHVHGVVGLSSYVDGSWLKKDILE